MRLARLFAVCLLSLGIVVQGHAGLRLMDPSCPMLHSSDAPQSAVAAHVGHDMADMADMGMEHHHSHGAPESGLTDAPPTGHSATHCAGHPGCQPLGSALVPVQVALVFGQFARQMPPVAAPAFRSYDAFLLWRPPALR
jgi:hypothetical protein